MLNLDDEERLDRTIEQFSRLIGGLQSRQSRLEHRIVTLYQIAAGAFAVVVASLSFLVVILSQQVPGMTAAITQMNDRFSAVAADMARMDRTIAKMQENMGHLPEIVANLDRIHLGVATMGDDVATLGETLVTMDQDLGGMTVSIADMRQSFELMEVNVARMGRDVNHLSTPARIMNQFNPFR